MKNYIYPDLHGEMGLVLMASMILLMIILNLSDLEKTAGNSYIVAKVSLEKSHQQIDLLKKTQYVDFEFYDILK